jgi:hypothetical protein
MNSSPSEKRIREHIATVARRNDDDHVILADALHTIAWPDGGLDRRHTEAQRWFERFVRWRGSGPTPIPRTCGCAIGRCLVCN